MAIKYIPKCPRCMMKCPRCQKSIPFGPAKCKCGWVSGVRRKS